MFGLIIVIETAHREEEEEENENENEGDGEDDGFTDGKHRSSRGLRVLSVKVKDIVAEKQNTSYKEVADTLIKEFNLKFKKQKPGEVFNSFFTSDNNGFLF